MKFLHEYPLQITTLTPVHIGCGEDYTPTDYVIENGTLFAFDSTAVSDALPDITRKELHRMVKGKPRGNVLTQIQNLFYKTENREALMTKTSHYLPVAAGAVDLYQRRIGKTAQHEDMGKKVINKLEIERTFYNPHNQLPVIPGSSLKGAIRTALLNSVNNGRSLTGEERHLLRENPKAQQSANQKLQQRLFNYSKLEYDPMRLIHVDDTHSVGNNNINTEIRFAVNRQRNERKPGQANRSMAEDKGLYQLLETLPELDVRKFRSRLLIQDVKSIGQADKLPDNKLHWTVEQIVQACNQFYRPLLKRELEVVSRRRYVSPEWERRMRKLLEGVNPLLDSNKAMLLRIGRHSGAEAVTLNGVRNIKIMQGKNKPKFESQPRTLWLVADAQGSRSEMVPFGWVLIEINPSYQPPVVLDGIDKQSDDEKRQWLKKQQERISELQVKLDRDKSQKEKENQKQLNKQAAKQKEQERLAEQARQREAQKKAEKAKFDSLPEHRQYIELLDKSMVRLNSLFESLASTDTIEQVLRTYPPTSQIMIERDNVKRSANQLSSGSIEIPADKRMAVAELLERAYDLIGWYEPGANKKQKTRQERKKRDAIARIRNG